MRVATCSVGSELLLGDQVDRNAAWLAARCSELGARVVRHVAVDDDVAAIVGSLRWLLDLADVVLVGGGLGPTPDDLTRDALAAVAGVGLHRDAREVARLRARHDAAGTGGRMPRSNLRQADVPEGAVVLPAEGSAPGLWLDHDGAALVALPGVPWEQRAMFEAHVVPRLQARATLRPRVTRSLRVVGLAEAEVGERAAALLEPHVGPDVAWSILAGAGQVHVRVTVSGTAPSRAAERAAALLEPVRAALGAAVVGTGASDLAHDVAALLRRRGETVALAESATAGLVTAAFGRVPGASTVLRGGVVTYATATKRDLLGVAPALLRAHPPVSGPVTEAMAVHVRELLGADWGVAVTGVAGPDDQDGVPVGTICWAVADGRGPVGGSRRLAGDRAAVQDRLVTQALAALHTALSTAPAVEAG